MLQMSSFPSSDNDIRCPVFHTQATQGCDFIPSKTLSILQRAVSALSITITSAVVCRSLIAWCGMDPSSLARFAYRLGAGIGDRVDSERRAGDGTCCTVDPSNLNILWAVRWLRGARITPRVPAFGRLSYVMASVYSGLAGTVGLIYTINGAQLASIGFNISMEPLSSIPPTAQSLTCVDATGYGFSTGQLGVKVVTTKSCPSPLPSQVRNPCIASTLPQ